MQNKYISPIDLYMERAFRLIIMLIPVGALTASLTYTVLKYLGMYPTVSWFGLIIFDITNLIYIFFGLAIRRNCTASDGKLNEEALRTGKVFLTVISLLQWNFISYLIPSTEFWAYFAFFAIYPVFFLDHIFVLTLEAAFFVCAVISWFIKGAVLLPMQDMYFVPNLVLRLVFVALTGVFFWLLTYLLQKVLVGELENIADYDSLTRLRNRRSLYRLGDAFRAQCVKAGEGFSVLMFDLDNFKAVNDQYGHVCGDRVLCRIADIMVAVIGDAGIVFRYGGEEFLAFVRGNSVTAAHLAERIRAAVEAEQFEGSGESLRMTLTVGVTESAAGMSIDQLINTADQYMYRGKQSGKNVVVG